MKQETINTLITLAKNAFLARVTPDKYAQAAAHEAAAAAATTYHQLPEECRDTAALLAATDFVCKTTAAATFSAQIAVTTRKQINLNRECNLARQHFRNDTTFLGRETNPLALCLSLVETLECDAFKSDTAVSASYKKASADQSILGDTAKHAALYVYTYTYASALSTYARALFISNQVKDQKKRFALFQANISSMLNKDLKYDIISPGLFLRTMCSTALKIIAGFMLIAGITTLILGSCGIAALPFIPMVAAGSASTAMGSGLLIGRFFARREHAKLGQANDNRMNNDLYSNDLLDQITHPCSQ